MCFSGFSIVLTEITVHLEKKKESFMTFVPVSSNGNPLSLPSKSQLRNTNPYHTSESVSGPPLKPFLYAFLKSGFDPEKDEGILFPLSHPDSLKFSVYSLQSSVSTCLEIKRS